MQWKHLFVVESMRVFPIDMLRYDNCAPCREIDSRQIEATFHDQMQGEPTTRRVVLKRYGRTKAEARHITEARWESFGWSVVPWHAATSDEGLRYFGIGQLPDTETSRIS